MIDEDLKQVLLVEDDMKDAELIIGALKSKNFANEIKHLKDGEEAIQYLDRATRLPAVILLDLKMPKIGGLEVLQHIRGVEKLRLLPVVILTSSKEERDLAEGYQLGVNAYVVKPLDFKQFFDAVTQIGAFWGVFNEPPPVKT